MGVMTMAEYEAAVRGVGDQLPQLVAMAYKDAATVMIAEARTKHLSGPKMPRGKTGGFEGSTLLSITGMKNRITSQVNIEGDQVNGWVGMNLTNNGYSYPRAHEYGLDKMPERPWLRPSVYAKQEYLEQRIIKRVLDGYGSKFT